MNNPYVHSTCGGVTNAPQGNRDKLSDPAYRAEKRITKAYCGTCKGYFPLKEFHWQDNGFELDKSVN
jgi:hypothetical protein